MHASGGWENGGRRGPDRKRIVLGMIDKLMQNERYEEKGRGSARMKSPAARDLP